MLRSSRRHNMPSPIRADVRQNETGAALILALVFVFVVGGVIASLSDFVMNGLNNTTNFSSARSLQYAASSATDLAIQSIRYTPLLGPQQTLNASPPSYCWGSGPSQLLNVDGVASISAWCSTAWTPIAAATRVVTISTCVSSVSAQNCAANPYLQAIVTFDDYPTGTSAPNTGACVVYCGTGLSVTSWTWSPTVPTVSSVSTTPATIPPSGPSSGGTSITIAGTGFVSGSTVNFVEESGVSPSSDNVVLPATNVVFNAVTSSLTAITPAITEGTSYFVTVTTPTGTSPFDPSQVFNYSVQTPTISLVNTVPSTTPAKGPTSGGTSVIISGTGFYQGASVNFIEENGISGAPVTPTVSLPATNVVVKSATSITVVSPSTIVGTNYFVTVKNSAGPSTTSTSNTFVYSLFFPIVSSVTTNGPSSLVITGTGFYEDAATQVNFVPQSGGTSVAATSLTVNTTNKITAVIPTLPSGNYIVEVTTSAPGTSTNQVIYTSP